MMTFEQRIEQAIMPIQDGGKTYQKRSKCQKTKCDRGESNTFHEPIARSIFPALHILHLEHSSLLRNCRPNRYYAY